LARVSIGSEIVFDDKTIWTALTTESLSEAIFKLDRFARSNRFDDLAEWCSLELNGYPEEWPNEGARLARTVRVVWVDIYKRPVLWQGDKVEDMSRTPLRYGVMELEAFGDQSIILQFPGISEQLRANQGIAVLGAQVANEQIKLLLQRIRTEARRRFLDVVDEKRLEESLGLSKMSLDLFISHSSKDAEIAADLIELLRSALPITADRIRCTSVDGYRLPAGTPTEERLRTEVHEAKAFIGLITPTSAQSAYVLFELGARWGAGMHLAPLLAGGADAGFLKGPLSGLNALDCSSPAQLHQFVVDTASILGYSPGSPASYQRHIDRLVEISNQRREANAVAASEEAKTRDDEPFLVPGIEHAELERTFKHYESQGATRHLPRLADKDTMLVKGYKMAYYPGTKRPVIVVNPNGDPEHIAMYGDPPQN
jgi:hypothetical protein